MDALRRPAAVFVWLVGLAVTVHFLAEPFYDPFSEDGPNLWRVINPFMMAAALIALAVAFARKRRADAGMGGPDARERWEANIVCYAAAAVAVLMARQCFIEEWGTGSFVGGADGQVWILLDTALPLLALATGRQLWREAEAGA